MKLDVNGQRQLKGVLFNLLIDPRKQNVKNACICLAAVASIELPLGAWPDFFSSMCSNSNNDNFHVRLAAVQTLGFLCEFIEDDSFLTPDDVCQVLGATVLNINPDQVELTCISLDALTRTIPYIRPNFAIENQRKLIMDGLIKAAKMEDDDCSSKAAEAISEVVSVGYDYISEFLQAIGEITVSLIQANQSEQASHILSFW